jgi:phosphatidylethanolamine/phosphatidyl-N-methylethanolamine N-methyltransferase
MRYWDVIPMTYRPSGMTVAGQDGKGKELPVWQGSWRGERRKERCMTQSGRPVLGPGKEELDKDTVTKAYARWAPVYDLVFGAVFERGRSLAIEAAERIGGRILEVGVGTGISLPHYSRANRLCGIDISAPMLMKARERVEQLNLSHVEGLWVMDAERLAFADESFDVIVAQYVITTVPNPEGTLDEFARVLKPGGEIVLVSRVGAEAGVRKALEKWFAPAAQKLGWRTEFSFARYAAWADRTPGMRLAERRATPPFGHFALIRFAKDASPSSQRTAEPFIRAAG